MKLYYRIGLNESQDRNCSSKQIQLPMVQVLHNEGNERVVCSRLLRIVRFSIGQCCAGLRCVTSTCGYQWARESEIQYIKWVFVAYSHFVIITWVSAYRVSSVGDVNCVMRDTARVYSGWHNCQLTGEGFGSGSWIVLNALSSDERRWAIHARMKCKYYDWEVSVSHHMTRPGSILRGVQIYLRQLWYIYPARVRIWVISNVTAPNKHKSCKSCSSRTGPSVTAKTMGALYCYAAYLLCTHDARV